MQTAVALGILLLICLDLPRLRATRRNLAFTAAAVATAWLVHQLNAWLRLPSLVHWPNLAVETLACFLVAELFGWTVHWVKHKHPFLWKFHVQHHREHEFNLFLTAHTHALEVLVSGTALAALLSLAGFSAAPVELYLLVYGLAKFFQHSSRDLSLGPLDRFLITPAYHRWHHEARSRCNYGVIFTLYDVLFRTVRWPDHTRPERYGVHDPAVPYGFWAEHLWFWRSRRPQGEGARTP